MKRSNFLLTAAVLSFVFGAMMFLAPATGAKIIGLAATAETGSVLRGLGGLIIGSGAINLLLRNQTDINALRGLLLANIITHLLGISADVWGLSDGVLTTAKIAPVEITHLFIGIGSLIYLLRLKSVATST
jgi:hypothetical protein